MEQRHHMTRDWKFGEGQTVKQERAEMHAAKEAGLERDYMNAQRWARMTAAETERKRQAKRARAA